MFNIINDKEKIDLFRNQVNNILNEEPLYKKSEITESNISFWNTLLRHNPDIKINSYCIHCKKETTHDISETTISGNVLGRSQTFQSRVKALQGFHFLKFHCLNVKSFEHNSGYIFFVEGTNIKKVGQYPSLADLQTPQSNKYRKLLADDYKNFTTAIRLFSNGIGAGSYVYLRRIFESLIVSTGKKLFCDSSTPTINEFTHSKMENKIEALKYNLPPEIVENKKIYSVLSKGIHELSEEECLEYFMPLKHSIEIILNYKLEKIEKELKGKNLSDSMSKILGKIN